jgi:hypothetical protein
MNMQILLFTAAIEVLLALAYFYGRNLKSEALI